MDWSADGRHIVFGVTTPTGLDLRVLPLSGDRTPFDVARTSFAEFDARFSPDSRWVAYQSNETGQSEIYVQPFPGPGRSASLRGGGTRPRWRRDAVELFYLASDRRLMACRSSERHQFRDRPAPRAVYVEVHLRLRGVPRWPAVPGHRGRVGGQPISVILNWKPPAN